MRRVDPFTYAPCVSNGYRRFGEKISSTPPGFNTRCTSRRARPSSGTCSSTSLSSATSTLASRSAIWWRSPTETRPTTGAGAFASFSREYSMPHASEPSCRQGEDVVAGTAAAVQDATAAHGSVALNDTQALCQVERCGGIATGGSDVWIRRSRFDVCAHGVHITRASAQSAWS